MSNQPTDPASDPNGHVDPAAISAAKASQISGQSTQAGTPPSSASPAQSTVKSGTASTAAGSTPNNPPPPKQASSSAPPIVPPPPSKIYPFQFSDIKEGDLDPLGNKVKWLISSDDNFIVYIGEEGKDGEELYVEWNMNDNNLLTPNMGTCLNRVGQLEAIDISYLPRARVISYKRMIAEGVARLFQADIDAAKTALDLAEAWITARNTEVARRWYLVGSGLAALVSAMVVILLGYWNQPLRTLPYFNLMVGTAFGGLGAWLSVIQRSRTAGLDVAAGPILHYLEGAFRIMAGSLGALLVAMAIRAGLFIQADRLSVIMVICMVAGVSERLVPSFIEQMESRTSGGVSMGNPSVRK